MENRRRTQENLLQAWMSMEVCIRGNRLLSDFSMNEMLICNTLYQQRQSGGSPVTATDLCVQTRLLKSQMNRILTSMEYRGLIRRERSTTDKRVIYVHLQEEALPRYLQEHEHVLQIVEAVCSELGDEDSKKMTALMKKAAAIVSNLEHKEDT